MQGHVEAGRRLARARHPHQYQVGLGVVHVDAVVMRERIVGGVDACFVLVEIDQPMRAVHQAGALGAKLILQRADERREHVQHQRATGGDDLAQCAIGHGVDHDRPLPGLRVVGLDPQRSSFRLVRIVGERQPMLVEPHVLELRQDAVADRLRGDAGGVGDEENRSLHTGSCLGKAFGGTLAQAGNPPPADWYAVGMTSACNGLLVPRTIRSGQYQFFATRSGPSWRAHSTYLQCFPLRRHP